MLGTGGMHERTSPGKSEALPPAEKFSQGTHICLLKDTNEEQLKPSHYMPPRQEQQ